MEKIKKYLIDSDVIIDYLRGVPTTRDFLLELKKKGILIISTVNIVEIYSGKSLKSVKKKKAIDSFLNEFKIIALDENLAKMSGKIRMEYQTPFADAIIAASAIELKAVLTTRNVKHFSKIKGLRLLSP